MTHHSKQPSKPVSLKQTSTPEHVEYKKVHIRTTVESDFKPVADNMREMDVLECRLNGHDPLQALESSIGSDYASYTIVCNETDTPLACFGIGYINMSYDYIWMLATDKLVETAGFEFARESKKVVQRLQSSAMKPLTNMVHKDNKVAIRWLRFCGAKFNDHPFTDNLIQFIIEPNV